jgi:hypothetical protein
MKYCQVVSGSVTSEMDTLPSPYDQDDVPTAIAAGYYPMVDLTARVRLPPGVTPPATVYKITVTHVVKSYSQG